MNRRLTGALVVSCIFAWAPARASGPIEAAAPQRAAIPALAPALPAAWNGVDEGAARLLIAAGAQPAEWAAATAEEKGAVLERGAQALSAHADRSPLSAEQREALRRALEAAPGRAAALVERETSDWRKAAPARAARWTAATAAFAAGNAAVEHAVAGRSGKLVVAVDQSVDRAVVLAQYRARFPEVPAGAVRVVGAREFFSDPTVSVIHHAPTAGLPHLMLAGALVLAAAHVRMRSRLLSAGAATAAAGLAVQALDVLRLGGVFDYLHAAFWHGYASPGDVMMSVGAALYAAGLLQRLRR